MKRPFLLAAAIAFGAGALGLVLGFVLNDPKQPKAPPRARPTLLVSSRWDFDKDGMRLHLVSGALASDPRRGFVLFQGADTSLDQNPSHKTPRFVQIEPRFFTAPDRSGPLHIVAPSRWDWVLDSPACSRAVLELHNSFARPSFFFLGRRLDPAHLPKIARRGVAVPVVYGPKKSKAVLLVGRGTRFGGSWHLYGYLPGFSLSTPSTISETLRRPLVGPDRGLFRVDPGGRRLVRIGAATPARVLRWKMPRRCSSWAANADGHYVACDDSIRFVAADGSRTTLLRQDVHKQVATRWTFVAPSPDRRTLLLEQDQYACGTSRIAYFLPTGGGDLDPVAGRLAGTGALQSEPLGWLQDNTALVAVQDDNECEGTLTSGIYRVWPDANFGELVVATSSEDATLWGPETDARIR